MTIVYLIFLGLALYWSIRFDGQTGDEAQKRHRYILLCIILTLIAGLSYGLGGDKWVYMENFDWLYAYPGHMSDEILLNLLNKAHMPLWTLLNLWIKYLTGSFYVVQIVQAAIVNGLIGYVAWRWSKRPFLFLILYFMSMSFWIFNTEVMREGIALGIGLIAMEQWMDGKRGVAGLLAVLALGFHISATILFVFPFVRFRISIRNLIIIWCIAFLGWGFSDMMLTYILPALLGGRGEMMVKVMAYASIATTLFGFLGKSIRFIILPTIVMLMVLPTIEEGQKREKAERLMAFQLAIAILACMVAGLDRFKNYTEIWFLIWLAEFIYGIVSIKEHKIIRIGTVAGVYLFVLIFFFSYYPKSRCHFYDYYFPYTTMLNERDNLYYRVAMHEETSGHDSNNNNTRMLKLAK